MNSAWIRASDAERRVGNSESDKHKGLHCSCKQCKFALEGMGVMHNEYHVSNVGCSCWAVRVRIVLLDCLSC